MIPKRYRHATFGNYVVKTEPQQKALDTIREWGQHCIRDGGYGNLVMFGNVGTGKGHLATATLRLFEQQLVVKLQASGDYDSRQARCEYVTAQGFLRELRATYNGEGQETRVFARYASAALLVIDEVGIGASSDYARDTLAELIDRRSSELLPTIVVSNLDPEEIKQYLDERAMDRLRDGMSFNVGFKWESYRGGDSVAAPPREVDRLTPEEAAHNARKIASILRHVN